MRGKTVGAIGLCVAGAGAIWWWTNGCDVRPFDLAQGRPSLLLVTIDTLRADRVGAYGAREVHTPSLDALAASGIRFDAAYAAAPLTLPSHVSMLSGQPPVSHSVRTNDGYRVPDAVPLVAEYLRGTGYRTAAFVGSVVLRKDTGLARGFETFDDDLGARAERRAEEVVSRATAWLDDVGREPIFLWVHLYDPHLPYDPPPPFARADRSYEGEIEYTDREVGRLIEKATERLGTGRLAVIAVADHGEGLGEHGERSHGALLYDSTIRVPLIVRLPHRRDAGSTRARPVSTAGIAAAMLQLARLSMPFSGIAASVLDDAGEEPILAETLYLRQQLGWSPLYAARIGARKFIDAPSPEMYDLGRDPAERQNEAAAERHVAGQLRHRLRRELDAAARHGAPPAAARSDSRTMQQLASLGYVSGAGTIAGGLERPGGINPGERMDVWTDIETGLECAQAGAKDEAAVIFARVLARDAGNVLAMKFLGALAVERGDLARGIALNENVLATGLHVADVTKNLVVAYARLGAEQVLAGHNAAAIATYERLVALDEGNLDVRERLGALLHRGGRRDAARAHFETVLKADPRRRAPALSLGIIELESGNPAAAVRLLEPITTGWPGATQAQAYLGEAQKQLAKREQ